MKVIYGDNGGTWMHEDVALEFARWLAPAFAIWCNDRIKELLTGNNASTLTIETVDRLKEALAMAQTTINRQASEIRDKSDLIADLEEIAKAIDDMQEYDSFYNIRYYWGVRENGTGMYRTCDEIIKWVNDWKSQIIGTYLIEFHSDTKRFSFSECKIK